MGPGALPPLVTRNEAVTCLGIVGALPDEIRPLTRQPVAAGAVTSLSAGVLLTISGIGVEGARSAGKRLLANGATALLSWGSAGALDERLAPGDLVLPKTVIGADGVVQRVSPDWHERLYHRLAEAFTTLTEPLVESQAVLASPAQKRALFECSGAVAVDMESAALTQLAHTAQVPFMVIRAISDTTDMRIPEGLITALDVDGRVPLLKILTEVILQPRDWPAVARLARGFRAAQATLAGVASCTGNSFCCE